MNLLSGLNLGIKDVKGVSQMWNVVKLHHMAFLCNKLMYPVAASYPCLA